ncbi:putative molybdenum carrier [Symmachiella macrocystis]|uniref:Putative molybdenum carrier n=1 Tax=Symmachiella macrocystis TaxID=2527985 RepID=A0A5C6BJQ0_9PLAN|nr:putative molybdenum carrier protein [Symmachiella macrocystis]TWU11962.1 putative molybdenum carrier [Symmachiella macrocystis]
MMLVFEILPSSARHKAAQELILPTTVEKIVSGGQTGVDRAALDMAIVAGIACGGWCPLGRKAEDGPLPLHYPLTETESGDYVVRTEWNVRDSDGTLILAGRPLTGGTALTERLAKRQQRPCRVAFPYSDRDVASVAEWLATNRIRTVNIAGPRESQQPGIYAAAVAFLGQLFSDT